jgi:prephenate dehydrogenase
MALARRRGDLRLAGGGLIDCTRLAGSPAPLWRGIVAANHAELIAAARAFHAMLAGMIESPGRLERVFAAARAGRAELIAMQGNR